MRHSTYLRGFAAATAIGLALAAQAYAASIGGRVVDSSGSVTLEGASVTIVELGRTAQSGPSGAFRFSDVPAGAYTLRVSYAGAEPVDTRIDVAAEGDLSLSLAIGPEADSYGESVLVVGQRANLASSISRQRAADGVETVLTRDAIGQFPDQNVAESVRRAPGVNVLNDQGEGRFIAVRGLDPNLNASSINGFRVPAPESDIRAVALDVVPSELVESIEIKKTLTPDMDADTIGASIEINTTSAFDRERSFVGVTLEGSYNDLTNTVRPKAALDFATVIDGKVGVSGGVSFYNRRFATDNIEMDGWGETDDGVVFADTLEYRDYDVERTRIGLSLGLDYKASDNTTLYIRGLHSIFEDQEDRLRLIFELDEDPYAGDADSASFSSADGQVRVERDIKDRYEKQLISSVVAGGETYIDSWKLEYAVGWAKASEKEKGSIDPIAFRRDFEEEGGEGGGEEFDVTFDYSKLEFTGYRVNSGLAAFLDPEEYGFEQLERTTLSLAEDEELTFRADVTREIALDGGTLDIKFGGKARMREKTYDLKLDIFDGFDGDFTLADVLGPQSYALAPIEPVPNRTPMRRFVYPNIGDFELAELDSDFESLIADYELEEDIYAGYLMAKYESETLRVIGGVRVEHTDVSTLGNFVELVEEGAIRDGEELEEDTLFVTPNGFSRSYTDWLPSLAVRFEPMPDVVLRGGVFRSVVRPTAGQQAPRFLIEENDEGEREGEFGNPALEPYEAWNYDASVEWYFASNAVVSAGVFYKTVDNFIANAVFEEVTFNGIYADEAIIPINGEEATIFGIEFNVASQLDFLPEPFDGFLVAFNYTYTDAEGDIVIGDGEMRTIPLPAASEHTYNAVLGYEKGPVSIRVAAAYRSGYLDELAEDAEEDRYVKGHLQWDITAKYRVSENAQIFAELINIGDEPYVAYRKGPVRDRLLQYEEYSFTGKAGVRLTF